MTAVHADIDALTGLRAALTRFRYAQREVAARGADTLEAARASLEAKAGRWRARLEQAQADLASCQDQAATATATATADDDTVDCSGYARAAGEAGQRLEQVRSWQQRVDAQTAEYQAAAARFAGVLETDLPRAEEQLAAVIASLRATRGVQTPSS